MASLNQAVCNVAARVLRLEQLESFGLREPRADGCCSRTMPLIGCPIIMHTLVARNARPVQAAGAVEDHHLRDDFRMMSGLWETE